MLFRNVFIIPAFVFNGTIVASQSLHPQLIVLLMPSVQDFFIAIAGRHASLCRPELAGNKTF
jgi:hypothetical protein